MVSPNLVVNLDVGILISADLKAVLVVKSVLKSVLEENSQG